LEVLTAMGGERALQTVGAAAKASEDELKDAGSRLLGEWMTVDAAPVLLDLAKTATEEKYEIRAIRGYLRIVRQFDVPLDERAAMCRSALQAARRDAEKKLVLEVLERYPSIDMLRLAVEIAKVPALKNDAAATALAIAQKISGSADVQQLLTQVGQKPVKVEIVKAEYGTDSKAVDVTETLRRNVRDFPLIVLAVQQLQFGVRRRSGAGRGEATEGPVPDGRASGRGHVCRGRDHSAARSALGQFPEAEIPFFKMGLAPSRDRENL
jgi:hypothetical protein